VIHLPATIMLSAAVITLALSSTAGAAAFSYNDCILDGLKGVASDAAARMVREACMSKSKEDTARQRAKDQEAATRQSNALKDEYGANISTDLMILDKSYKHESNGSSSVGISNKAVADHTTITYVMLLVDTGGCWGSGQAYSYKLVLSPGTSTRLRFPHPGTEEKLCLSIIEAKGRPSSWRDIILSGSENPTGSGYHSR
jgi:hypothetical protein